MIPNAASMYQIQFIYSLRNHDTHHHLYQRLKQILCSPLYTCPETKMVWIKEFERIVNMKSEKSDLQLEKLQQTMMNGYGHGHVQGQSSSLSPPPYKIDFADRRCITDPEIYQLLHTFFHTVIRNMPECRESKTMGEDHTEGNDGRVESRIDAILALLEGRGDGTDHPYKLIATKPGDPHFFKLLDVGCGNAEITQGLAEFLNIPKDNCVACDIKESKEFSPKVLDRLTYVQLDPQQTRLDTKRFPDSSFDVVVALMSLHHIPHYSETLKEIVRVLKPNGRLVFREHDLFTPYLAVILDIVHALYDCVFKKIQSISPETFCTTYRAFYKGRTDWQREFKNVNLVAEPHSHDLEGIYRYPISIRKLQKDRPIKNVLASYMGIYRKPASSIPMFTLVPGNLISEPSKKQKLEKNQENHENTLQNQ